MAYLSQELAMNINTEKFTKKARMAHSRAHISVKAAEVVKLLLLNKCQ